MLSSQSMNERENEDFISCKRFKSSHEYENLGGGHKGFPEDEAGNYFLGPVIREYVMAPVPQYLARKKGTDECYLMKMLVLDDSDSPDQASLLRRTFFHNECSFLSVLKNHPGVIQLCDFFKDYVYEDNPEKSEKTKIKRICMVLECLIPHGHHNPELIPLNHYLKDGRLTETEALYTFYNLLLVLEDLHKNNIIHRDIKFSNIILNRKSLKVKLMDFYHAEFLTPTTKFKAYQCRVTSHASPNLFNGNASPVLKICDMCSAGLVLYGMLSGSVMKDDYSLSNTCISDGTKELLRKIQFNLEASEAVDMVSTLLAVQCTSQNPSLFIESKSSDQVVPECADFGSREQQEGPPPARKKSVASESPPEPENEGGDTTQKIQKTSRAVDGNPRQSSSPPSGPKPPQQNGLMTRKEIKYAMLRLGATSVNSINALSFNYAKKNLCRS